MINVIRESVPFLPPVTMTLRFGNSVLVHRMSIGEARDIARQLNEALAESEQRTIESDIAEGRI